jgi:FkbM family methyltransferase
MRKIFLNIGAGKGSDVKGFIDIFPDYKDWEIFVFECNPDLIPIIESVYPDANVLNYAASTETGTSKLYLGNEYINSSLNPNKINVSEDKYIDVNTIDISKWILDNFHKDDYIILTLDIEGEEYNVLEKMIKDQSLDFIDELYVEFHGKKIDHITLEYENSLVEYLVDKFNDKVYIYEYHNHEQFIKLNQEAI